MANERRDNLFQAAVTAAWNKYLANNNYIPNNRSTFKDNICPETSFISNDGYELRTKQGCHVATISFSELEQCLPKNVPLTDVSTDNNNAIKLSKHFATQQKINDLKAAAADAKNIKNFPSLDATSSNISLKIKSSSQQVNSSRSEYKDKSSQSTSLHPSISSKDSSNCNKQAAEKDDNNLVAPFFLILLIIILAAAVSPQGFFTTLINRNRFINQSTSEQKIYPVLPPQPVKPIKIPDPAQQMHNKVTAFEDPNYPHLSAYISDYKKVAGMLARLQFHSLRNELAKSDLPTVLINATNLCKTERSIGVYHRQCKSLGVDFFVEGLEFETDEEIITVIAHEWGHHLVNISNFNSKFSLNENEIVADCFAGLVLGFYHKNGLMTIQEVQQAGKMMMYLGNNNSQGIHPNSETRLRSFASAWSYIAKPNNNDIAKAYGNYCGSLDGIIDKDKIANAKLGWVAQ